MKTEDKIRLRLATLKLSLRADWKKDIMHDMKIQIELLEWVLIDD